MFSVSNFSKVSSNFGKNCDLVSRTFALMSGLPRCKYLPQFPIPDALDRGLHDHFTVNELNDTRWKEMGKQWRRLCRRLVCHVASVAGSGLKWLERMTEEHARASLREKSNLHGMTLDALHSA